MDGGVRSGLDVVKAMSMGPGPASSVERGPTPWPRAASEALITCCESSKPR